MTDIPNTEYITINKNGIFVGGKPATTYRGEEIYYADYTKEVLILVQEQNPNIAEFHIGAFATQGRYAKSGNPDWKPGLYAWCRVKYKNGNLGAWVFNGTYASAALCANYCAFRCAYFVRNDADFRAAVFGATIEKQDTKSKTEAENPELKKLERVDFSKLPKSPIELNGYRILVEQIQQNTK